ncbi:hypothetical protein FRB96_007449 [Tulasnella sp. 330]|nr:hypothetical protein FRB96_007449 [Tulasnella sp. 330]KAG8880104.1 hypothetical protein FRB97_001090 [Tulasnella sp. 331]KAG8886766.1 hypothetical protein FRB98_001031 [Tulasnella sp. 332]
MSSSQTNLATPPQTVFKSITLPNKVEIFYQESGSISDKPTLLLLHGFPSSSNQYRNLIPLLAPHYHVLAPDLPGFGFTNIPSSIAFQYTFTSLTDTVEQFLDALKVTKFVPYGFDYGAPITWRLALRRPEAIKAIVSQNGNAYDEGLGATFWAGLQKWWASGLDSDRDVVRAAALSYEHVKFQYLHGAMRSVDPYPPFLDFSLLSRPGNFDIQLALFKDYATNVEMYPQFHEYFRKSQVKLLAVWGKNDIIFVPEGAEAFKRDLPDARVKFVDAGHFVLETHVVEIAQEILNFLGEVGV